MPAMEGDMYYQLRLLVCEGDAAKLWYMVFDHPLQLITFAFGRVPGTNYFVVYSESQSIR